MVLFLIPLSSVGAAQDTVTVTATGSYVGFSNAPATKALGVVDASSTHWSNDSAPTFPLDDGECYFTITNNSSVTTNTTINTADWTGGVGWTCSDTGTPGADTFGLYAGASGTSLEGDMVIVKKTATFNTLKANLAAYTDFKWEFKFLAPTSFTDGVQKSGTITLTMTAV